MFKVFNGCNLKVKKGNSVTIAKSSFQTKMLCLLLFVEGPEARIPPIEAIKTHSRQVLNPVLQSPVATERSDTGSIPTVMMVRC